MFARIGFLVAAFGTIALARSPQLNAKEAYQQPSAIFVSSVDLRNGASNVSLMDASVTDGQQDQECMICTHDIGFFGTLEWVYTVSWGSELDCEGEEEFEDVCARCDDFEYWQDAEDCGDSGDSVETGFDTKESAELFGQTFGCESALCRAGLPEYELLSALVQSESGAESVASLLAGSERLSFNEDRRAIQGVGCNNTVVLHIVVTPEFRDQLLKRLFPEHE
jgi:hypothetical protein